MTIEIVVMYSFSRGTEDVCEIKMFLWKCKLYISEAIRFFIMFVSTLFVVVSNHFYIELVKMQNWIQIWKKSQKTPSLPNTYVNQRAFISQMSVQCLE